MKFSIKNIVLWLKNGKQRVLSFEPNKVNVITGESNTGKTAILDIFDYCFFASKSKISESVINENTAWYGIEFNINDKVYTIARKSLVRGKVSNEYYFSSIGGVPETLTSNNSENAIKSIIETEFNIDREVTVSYGGQSIRVGSKISLRYFLMFNTISVNIIENDSGIYFDKQNENRYREALPRIFDLAVGIETVENVLKKEKKQELEAKLKRFTRKRGKLSQKISDFQEEQVDVIKKAKEYSLIDRDLSKDEAIDALRVESSRFSSKLTGNSETDKLEMQRNTLERKIQNLRNFISEYDTYKRNLKKSEDSLKPIRFLLKHESDLIKTSIFSELMTTLEANLEKIKKVTMDQLPLDRQVNDLISGYNEKLKILNEKLSTVPDKQSSFDNDREKHFFMGRVKAELDLYCSQDESEPNSYEKEIEALQKNISNLTIEDVDERKEMVIELIQEIISDYISQTGSALENYINYKPVFKYTDKSLLLRKPKTAFIENVGSSSNHMFLHLFFSLSMHDVISRNSSQFVPPILIIDQPSRPYWGDEENRKTNMDHSDEVKIKAAFRLLNSFITDRDDDQGEFQMIVFEHVPTRLFKDLVNFHLVAEFIDGNALIPNEFLDK